MTATVKACSQATNKLTGQALIDHVNKHNDCCSKTEMCIDAGYVRENGKPAFVDFYTELLNAKTEAGLIQEHNSSDADWYDNLSATQQELYDAIEEHCPEFEKLSTDQCDEFMSELDDIGITNAEQFSDAYYSTFEGWNPERDFAEELMTELGAVNEDSPVFFAIDWQRVWDHSLSYDFCTIEFDGVTYFFRNN